MQSVGGVQAGTVMNIFECGAIGCAPVGASVGAFIGYQYSALWLVVGTVTGGVVGFFSAPLLGLVVLLVADRDCKRRHEHRKGESKISDQQEP